MKIVQINQNYNKGSIGRTVAEFHEYLINNGHEDFVFTADDSDESNNVFRIGNTLDHKIHALCSKLFGKQAYFSKMATKKLLSRLSKIKPDLVHLRNLHANYIHLPLLLKYLANNDIPTVITLHDCWFLTGKCCYYTHVNCDKWQTGCYDCPALKYDNNSWFFDTTRTVYQEKKELFSRIKRLAVIGNSSWTTQQARLSYLKNATIVQRIYNWIDMSVFYPRNTERIRNKHNISPDDFVVLGVSQIWKNRKGLNVFISLAKRFKDFKFILVGHLKSEEQLPSNIICIRFTDSVDELCQYYTLADVLLNPSLQETFGKISAEALCCGTPIIVNNATANPELVGDGCGYIVNNNDIEEYSKYMLKVKKCGRNYYKDKCISFAKHNFSKAELIDEYMKVYTKIIK